MLFVKLHDSSGQPMSVNLELIEAVKRVESLTRLFTQGNTIRHYSVKETPQEIFAQAGLEWGERQARLIK